MFGFLKKQLKKGVEMLSRKIEEPEEVAPKAGKPEHIKPKKPEKPEFPESERPIEVREDEPLERTVGTAHEEIEEGVENGTPEIEGEPVEILREEGIGTTKKRDIKKLMGVPEEHEKRGFFSRLRGRVTERTLEEKDIDEFFADSEIELLQSNVALEVSDFLKGELKEKLVKKPIKRSQAQGLITNAFEESIFDAVNQGSIDLEERIKAAKKEERPFCIAFLGMNGGGKCVSGDTLIPLADGRILPAERLYEEQKAKYPETQVEDGFIIKPLNSPEVFTIEPEKLRLRKAKATVLWKLKKESLVKVVLENGHQVKVTSEHPFFVLRPGKIQEVRADAIEKGEYIMMPKKFEISKTVDIGGAEILRKIAHRKLFVYSPFVREAYKLIRQHYGTLKNAHGYLGIDASLVRFGTQWRKAGVMPSTLIMRLYDLYPELRQHLKNVEIKYGKSMTKVRIPRLDDKFYEFLGLFYAEGYISDQYIEFTNTDNLLLDRFASLSKSIFNNQGVIKADIRKDKSHIKKVLVSDKTVSYFLRKLLNLPAYKKGTFMEIPDFILAAPNTYISSMIRAYWECDGSISRDRRRLESTTASHTFSMQMSSLLLRFGIMTTLSTKEVKGKPYYRLSIFGKEKIERFSDEIGTLREESRTKLVKLTKMPSQFEKTELIPMQGQLLRTLRQSSGISQHGVADVLGVQHSLISQYETRDVSIPSGRLSQISSIIDSGGFLNSLSTGQVRWSRVKEKQNILCKGYVYDFTVPETHNFVANNIVVHNTTSIAKLARYLTNRKHGVVLAAGDTFRAASIEQLEHHAKKLGVDIVKHKYGSDAAAVIFDAIQHAKGRGLDVVLADTAGRAHTNKNLMEELKKVVRVNKPDLKILVVDSLTGNDAVEQARQFNEAVGVDAVLMTKVDVNEKGGSILSVCYAIKKPILFIGTGQGYDDIKLFDPKEFVKGLME